MLQIVVLALVQGITEFLPISSSGHLILVPKLTGWQDQGLAVDLAVHVGTLFAVLLYYKRDIADMTRGGFAMVGLRSATDADRDGMRLLTALMVAALPIFVVGGFLVVMGWDEMMRNAAVIGWSSIIFGLFLYYADTRRPASYRMDRMTLPRAVVIGLVQLLAIIPGGSRAGTTMMAARFLGFDRVTAARFSMLLSIPTIAAAGLVLALKLVQADDAGLTMDAVLCGALAFVVAYAAIVLFMRWISRATMTPFVVYRVVLGTGLLIWVYL
ncbi:MAG: undecaprenyl-diphosphate phosphatase [Sphingomonadales bacterium]